MLILKNGLRDQVRVYRPLTATYLAKLTVKKSSQCIKYALNDTHRTAKLLECTVLCRPILEYADVVQQTKPQYKKIISAKQDNQICYCGPDNSWTGGAKGQKKVAQAYTADKDPLRREQTPSTLLSS